jgi:hypothetical protein
MSEGGMLYLIMVVAAFLIFSGALMWAMIETTPRQRREPSGDGVQRSAAHQH